VEGGQVLELETAGRLGRRDTTGLAESVVAAFVVALVLVVAEVVRQGSSAQTAAPEVAVACLAYPAAQAVRAA
jgi:hypothetical protein